MNKPLPVAGGPARAFAPTRAAGGLPSSTRTRSALDILRPAQSSPQTISLVLSRNPYRHLGIKLHNVQNKSCMELHSVQSGVMKHIARIQAEKRVALTSAAVRNFKGSNEAKFLALDASLKAAITELVAAELAHPTESELKKRAHRISLENRGLLT
jgi:hypothetical protein